MRVRVRVRVRRSRKLAIIHIDYSGIFHSSNWFMMWLLPEIMKHIWQTTENFYKGKHDLHLVFHGHNLAARVEHIHLVSDEMMRM